MNLKAALSQFCNENNLNDLQCIIHIALLNYVSNLSKNSTSEINISAKIFDSFRLKLEGQTEWIESKPWKPEDYRTHPVVFKGLKPGTPYKVQGQYCLNNEWCDLFPIITYTTNFDDPWSAYRYYVDGVIPKGGCLVNNPPEPIGVDSI